MRRLRALAGRVRGEAGYSLFELLVVMMVLGVVLTGLTTVFVSATRAEYNANQRFQAQQNARLGLDSLATEVHCASAINAGWTASAITLTLPTGCPTGSGQVSWCTVNVSSGRYQLFRQPGATCDGTGTLKADYLTSGSAFTYTCSSGSGLLPVLSVSLPVNTDPVHARTYSLGEDLAFRNGARC